MDLTKFVELVRTVGVRGWPATADRHLLFAELRALEGETEIVGTAAAKGELIIPDFPATWNWAAYRGRLMRLACPFEADGLAPTLFADYVDPLAEFWGEPELEVGDVYIYNIWIVLAGRARVLFHTELEVCTLELCSHDYPDALADDVY